MSFAPLLSSLRHTSTPYHLVNGIEWAVVAGEASSDQSADLIRLAGELKALCSSQPLSVPELNVLRRGIEKLSLTPQNGRFFSLFSRATSPTIAAATAAKKKFQEAVSEHFQKIASGPWDGVKRALGYLTVSEDLYPFSQIYRELFYTKRGDREQIVDNLKALIDQLCRDYPHFWLRKIQRDPDWPCGLVADPQHRYKALDLQGLGVLPITSVLKGHKECSDLTLSMSSAYEVIVYLQAEQLLDNVAELDLSYCKELELQRVQGALSRLPKLHVTWPSDLRFDLASVLHDSPWRRDLERIARQQQSRRDFTPLTSLMRGIQNASISIQTNFLLSCPPEHLGELQPLKTVNVSGIQRVTFEHLCRFNYQDREVCIYLSYCPNITREGFSQLLHPHNSAIVELSLSGCPQVDDSFFEEHCLLTVRDWFVGTLSLELTKVTPGCIRRLRAMQPRADIRFLPTYLPDISNFEERSFGVDRQGLTEAALEATLLFIYTGRIPYVSLPVAIESILSNNSIISVYEDRQKFKEYCRYILQINVSHDNVHELHAFALQTEDDQLTYICRTYVQTFLSPHLPDVWGALSDEKRRIFEVILREPEKPEPWLPITDYVLYFSMKWSQVSFSAQSAPFFDLVTRDDYVNFARAYARAPVSQRDRQDRYVQTLVERHPNKLWLHQFQRDIPRALSLIPNRKESKIIKMLDLRDFESWTLVNILREFWFHERLQCRLNCSEETFCRVAENHAFTNVAVLDLRDCQSFRWNVLELYLVQMKHLHNVFLPLTLSGLTRKTTLSASWSKDLYPVIACNLIHVFATNKEAQEQHFLEQEVRGFYSQYITAANIILRGFPAYMIDWNRAVKYIIGLFLFTATSKHKKSILFPPNMDLSGMDFVTSHLLSLIDFQDGPLNLCFEYTSSFTKDSLLNILSRKRELRGISLYGSSHVDDSFFVDMPGSNISCVLDLRGTSTSPDMAASIKRAGYTVHYDEEYLKRRVAWQRQSQLTSNDPVLVAISHFEVTGYYPLLTLPLAMQIIESKHEMDPQKMVLLKNYCIVYLELNICSENVVELYRFACRISLGSLQATCRYFVEIFCNPYYPPLGEKADERFCEILCDHPPMRGAFPPPHNRRKIEPQYASRDPKNISAGLLCDLDTSLAGTNNL